MFREYLKSNLGLIKIEASFTGLTSVSLVSNLNEVQLCNEHTMEARIQLKEFFGGKRKNFEIDFDFQDASAFNKEVWNQLLTIPFGKTSTYSDIAKSLGNEKAVRAVGTANGKNPIAIIIPCHRVIGSDGSLTGYAYGLDVKRKLLTFENPMNFTETGKLF